MAKATRPQHERSLTIEQAAATAPPLDAASLAFLAIMLPRPVEPEQQASRRRRAAS